MRRQNFRLLSLFLLLSTGALAQTSGKINDIYGTPESDVEVRIKGTDKITYTDLDGNFSIDAKVGDVLIIKDREVKVTSEDLGDLSSLFTSNDEIELETTVVTGYSVQRKEEVTASVGVVSAKDLIDSKSPNITNLLQGKVAGLNIVTGSGRPGSTSAMRVRGQTSIYGDTGALWVVDGVIFHGTPNINPNDVETVSVLKDAAATSQYGSRGANGVIIVTTKRGKGQGLTVNVDYSSSWNKFNAGNFEVMNGKQMFDNFKNMQGAPAIPDALENTNFDWVKNGTQIGTVQDANVSISSISDKTNLYATINYFDEKGTVKGYDYERLSARLNIDHKLSDRLTFKPKLNATYTTTENREHSLYGMYMNMPWDKPYLDNGKFVNPREDESNGNINRWYGRDYSNYYYDLQTNYSTGEIFDIQANLDFQWKINNDFTFESTNNVQYYNNTSMSYTDPRSISGSAYDGQVYQFTDKRIVRLFNQMLRYNKKIDLHSINAYVAYEYSDYEYKSLNATKQGITPGSQILDNGANPFAAGGTKNDYAFQAGLAQLNYGYDNRYYAQASYRLDGSSRFGENNRYAHFYAFSAGWNISNEEFLKGNDVLTNLKLRASYGVVGNAGSNYYMQFGLYNLSGQYNGQPALVQGQYKNGDVSWESTKDANVGLEVGLYNRVNMTLDLYSKNTDNLLHFVRFPDTSGWTGYWDNVGRVNNRGVEFSINASIFQPTSEFQWNVGFNIATNKNEIKELYDGQAINNGLIRYEEGYDINSWYMRKWVGVNPENGNPLWERVDPNTGEVTQVSNWNNATLQHVGKKSAKYFGGFNTNFSYKGFVLSADFVYSKGGEAYNAGRELFDADGAYPYYNQMQLQEGWSRWSESNRNATHPKLVFNNTSLSNKQSSRYLEDASFLRMRSIRFGYNFKNDITSRLGVKSLGLYVSGDNLWTLTDYSGADVEAVITGDNTSNYPNPKRFTLGVNVTF